MFNLIGPIISGLALMWTIYTFFLKKREEAAQKDRQDFMSQIGLTKDLLNTRVVNLESQLIAQMKEFESLKQNVHILNEKIKIHTQVIQKNYDRMEKIMDRHEQKLDDFGKIIIKDKK